MKKLVRIGLDVGNSGTRGVITYLQPTVDKETGKQGNEILFTDYFELPNTYAYVTNQVNLETYKGTDSKIFAHKTFKENQVFHFATGAVMKEYNVPVRPTGLERKSMAETTYLGINRALYEVVDILMEKLGATLSELQNDYVFELRVAMPPNDVEDASLTLNQVYKGLVKLQSVFPVVYDITIQIRKVSVVNEGIMGYLASTTNYETLTKNKLENAIEDGTVLLFDIGAGTTEIMIVSKNILVDNSRQTLRIGCKNIVDILKHDLEKQYGFNIPLDIATLAAETGYLIIGRKREDIINSLNKAREQVAQQIVTSVLSYLASTNIPLINITDVLTIGGGSIEEQNSGMRSLGSHLQLAIQPHLKGAEGVKLHKLYNQLVSDKYFVNSRTPFYITPRTLNVLGIAIVDKTLKIDKLDV